MIQWIRYLLGLCNHQWETVLVKPYEYNGSLIGYVVFQQCSKCGGVRRKKMVA